MDAPSTATVTSVALVDVTPVPMPEPHSVRPVEIPAAAGTETARTAGTRGRPAPAGEAATAGRSRPWLTMRGASPDASAPVATTPTRGALLPAVAESPPSRPPATPREAAPASRGFDAHVDEGRVVFRDRNLRVDDVGVGCFLCDGVDSGFPVGAAVSFDAGDWLSRRHGHDPYRSEKARVLAATFGVRFERASKARRERLTEALRDVSSRLRSIWHDPRVPAAERRRALFQMWDECDESGDEAIDAVADAVRASVFGFVRRELPAGSVDAYTPAALERLNAQRESRQRFAPY